MKKRRRTKAENQTYHFKKRCDERLGVQINRKSIQKRIKEKEYDEYFYMLNRQSNRVTRYRYKFRDKWYIIPYDKNTHKVITIFEDRNQDVILEAKTETISQTKTKNPLCWINRFIKFLIHIKVK